MPKCKFCQNEITWKWPYKEVPAGEKNIPFNPDGSPHDCRLDRAPLRSQPPSMTPVESEAVRPAASSPKELPRVIVTNVDQIC